MPLAVTLRLDPAGAAPLEAMWRKLAERDIDHDRHRLGYGPHVTLAIYPDETPVAPISAALEQLAPTWNALPVTLAGLGIFPGANSILWAVPVVTPELLDRQEALQSALPDLAVHPHYRPGAWVPHVTLSGPLSDVGRALAVLTPAWQPIAGQLSHLELLRFRPVELLGSHILRTAPGVDEARAP